MLVWARKGWAMGVFIGFGFKDLDLWDVILGSVWFCCLKAQGLKLPILKS